MPLLTTLRMPTLPPLHRQPRAAAKRHDPVLRASTAERGYGHRWQQARVAYLSKHPLCVRCANRGRPVPAEVVDHIAPHRGEYALMWDESNWQALCKRCHDRKTAREDGGFGRPRAAR